MAGAQLDIAVTATNQASSALSSVSKDLGKVDDQARTSAKSIDNVGEAGGNAERGLQGLADTAGFLGEQLGLPVGPAAEMAGTFAQLGGGIEALAQGFPGLIKQMAPMLASIGAQITATWAYVTALYAQAVAFVAANAPIIAIIAGLALLAAGIYLVITNWGTIVDFFQGTVVPIFDKVKDAMSSVVDWITSNWPIVATLLSGPFLPIVALATDAFGIRSALIGAFQAIVGAIPGIWNAITGIVTSVFEGLVGGASDLWGLKSAVEGAVSAVVDFIPGVWNAITGIITSVWEGLVGGAADLWGLKSGVEGAVQAVVDFIPGVWDTITGIITGVWEGLISGASDLWGVKTAVENAITAMVDWIKQGIDRNVEFWTALPGRIASALSNLSNDMYNIGVGIMQGLLNGIAGMAQTLWNKLTEIIGGLINKGKELLGMDSPSKVFADIGYNIGTGMALGIMRAYGLVENAAGQLVHAATGTVVTAATIAEHMNMPHLAVPGPEPLQVKTGGNPTAPFLAPGTYDPARAAYWNGAYWQAEPYRRGTNTGTRVLDPFAQPSAAVAYSSPYTGATRMTSTPGLTRPAYTAGQQANYGGTPVTINMTFNGPTNPPELKAAINETFDERIEREFTIGAMQYGGRPV